MLLLMVLVSATLTAAIPSGLLRRKRKLRVLAGVLLPVLGALVYTASVLATDLLIITPDLLSDLDKNPRGAIHGLIGMVMGVGFFMFLLGVPIMAMSALSNAFYVAIPMGVLHVELVTRIGRPGRPRVAAE